MVWAHLKRIGKMALNIMKRRQTAGMSEDEAENQFEDDQAIKIFHTVEGPWKDSNVTAFLHTLDRFALQDRIASGQPNQALQARVRSHRPPRNSHTRHAPRNLPINFYDPEWLATLSPAARLALNPLEEFHFREAVDFAGLVFCQESLHFMGD